MTNAEVINLYPKLLAQVLADAEEDIVHLGVPVDDTVVVAVYFTILQSAIELALLLQQPTITAGGVLRGIVESYADLCALIKTPHYAARLLATFYEQKCNLYRDMLRDPSNPYHADLARQHDPQSNLDECQKLLEKQKSRGFVPLSNFDRLEQGGLRNEYRSLYWQLCLESHNSISAVEARHIEQTSNGIDVHLRKDNHPGELLKYYDSLTSIVIDASLRIHQFASSQDVPRWQSWNVRLVQFRENNVPKATPAPSDDQHY
jgi:Family of unknown function (DUF5677)